MNDTDVLQVTLQPNGLLLLCLNRPAALNALNEPLLKKLHSVLLDAKDNSAVKALILTGNGKAFCAGADIEQLKSLNGQSGMAFARYGQMVFRLLEQLGKPSLAAINGYALGGGCELAMSATLRIAVDQAQFGQPEVKLGVIPGFGGTQRLSRLIGKGRALDMCLSGKLIKAEEALNWGLITEVVASAELLVRANRILEQLIKLPPLALKSIMKVIDDGYELPFTEACEFEALNFALCCTSKDKEEGVNAFLQKREAEFSGE